MKQWLKNRATERLANHVMAKYEMIKPVPKKGLFNHRCFSNAVEWALNHEGTKVIEVIYIDTGTPILHYVNQNRRGEYLETTLGHMAPHFVYYRIREIHRDDWQYIDGEFQRAQRAWTREWSNSFINALFGIESIL